MWVINTNNLKDKMLTLVCKGSRVVQDKFEIYIKQLNVIMCENILPNEHGDLKSSMLSTATDSLKSRYNYYFG